MKRIVLVVGNIPPYIGDVLAFMGWQLFTTTTISELPTGTRPYLKVKRHNLDCDAPSEVEVDLSKEPIKAAFVLDMKIPMVGELIKRFSVPSWFAFGLSSDRDQCRALFAAGVDFVITTQISPGEALLGLIGIESFARPEVCNAALRIVDVMALWNQLFKTIARE